MINTRRLMFQVVTPREARPAILAVQEFEAERKVEILMLWQIGYGDDTQFLCLGRFHGDRIGVVEAN